MLIMLLLWKLKGFGDMKNSIPKHEDQKKVSLAGNAGRSKDFFFVIKILSDFPVGSVRGCVFGLCFKVKTISQRLFSHGVRRGRGEVKGFFLVNQNILSFAFPAFSANPARE